MYSDFEPIIHELKGRPIKVWAVADVHIGARECDLQGFRAFLKRVQSDDDSYIVLCGDLVSNGLKDSHTNVYEETMPPSAQIELAAELLEPVKDKILGAVGGNHELRSRRAADLDPLHTVFCILGRQHLYRTNFAFLRINMCRGNTKNHFGLLLLHGKTENKRKQFDSVVEGVDAVIGGHTHDGLIRKPSRLVFTTSNQVKVKPLVSITATSWLQYGGYALSALHKPVTTSDPQYLLLEFSGTNATNGKISAVW